jgi:hypothetical protein
MLREPQHERKLLNDIKTPPFVLSAVEGLRLSSLAACSWQLNSGLTRNSKPETRTDLCPRCHRYNYLQARHGQKDETVAASLLGGQRHALRRGQFHPHGVAAPYLKRIVLVGLQYVLAHLDGAFQILAQKHRRADLTF